MAFTRLGLYGGARQLYGDFSGKVPFTPVVPPSIPKQDPKSHLRLVKPKRADMLLEENLTMTQRTSLLMNGLVDLDPLTGDGSPEGIQAAKSRRFYFDLTNKVAYVKFLDAIDLDATQGWTSVAGDGGNALNYVTVTADYSQTLSDDVLFVTDTVTITLLESTDAIKNITIKNSGTSTVTLSPSNSETIELTTLSSTQSITLAPGATMFDWSII